MEAVDWTEEKSNWPHLKEIPFQPKARGKIDIILGGDEPTLLQSIRDIVGVEGCPVGRQTPLGWLAFGPTKPNIPLSKDSLESFHTILKENDPEGNQTINFADRLGDTIGRFRWGPYAIMGDIKEMFLRIRLPPGDQRFHRFLLMEGEKIVDYTFQSHIFGVYVSNGINGYCNI